MSEETLAPSAAAFGLLKRWRGRRRRLRVTTEGKILLVITLLSGFAAINTGNNLLFFGWGLLLSAIIISGVLSEATLRTLEAQLGRAEELRAGQLSPVAVALQNKSTRLPAFGVEVTLKLRPPTLAQPGAKREEPLSAPCRYQLRLNAGESRALWAHFQPEQRGLYPPEHLSAVTAFPFGFFEKERTFDVSGRAPLVVFPRRVEVAHAAAALRSRLGTAPTHRAGPGDEFFALRPFREGDDYRHVYWRRSARSARWVVRETEVWASRWVSFVKGDVCPC